MTNVPSLPGPGLQRATSLLIVASLALGSGCYLRINSTQTARVLPHPVSDALRDHASDSPEGRHRITPLPVRVGVCVPQVEVGSPAGISTYDGEYRGLIPAPSPTDLGALSKALLLQALLTRGVRAGDVKSDCAYVTALGETHDVYLTSHLLAFEMNVHREPGHSGEVTFGIAMELRLRDRSGRLLYANAHAGAATLPTTEKNRMLGVQAAFDQLMGDLFDDGFVAALRRTHEG